MARCVLITGMSGTGEVRDDRRAQTPRTSGGDEEGWSELSIPMTCRSSESHERAAILRDLEEVEPLLRASADVEIHTRLPLDQVVALIEDVSRR